MGYQGNSTYVEFTSTSQGFFSIPSMLSSYYYKALGGAGSEAEQQAAYAAGDITLLWGRVKTAATSSSTVVLRKSSANGNNTFSINANTTGAFSDATHTDVISSGNLVDIGVTAGSTALVLTILAFTFTTTSGSNTVTKLGGWSNVSSATTGTKYAGTAGVTGLNGVDSSNQAAAKNRQRKVMTVNNFGAYVTGGPNSGNWTSQIGGSAGAISANTDSGGNALIQDTTHSDSIAVGNDYNWTFPVTTSSFTFSVFYADWTSTTGDCIFCCANDQQTTFNTSTTSYAGLSGALNSTQSSETNAQVTVNSQFLFSQLLANVAANTITGASTVNLRANAGNPASGPTVSITASTTGVFLDSTDTYQAASTDAMDYQIITASTGTSLTLFQLAVWGNATPGAVATGPSYYHFDNSDIKIGRQFYNSFSDQMQVFG